MPTTLDKKDIMGSGNEGAMWALVIKSLRDNMTKEDQHRIFDSRTYAEVTITLNGVELDFSKFVKSLMCGREELIQEAAKEIIDSKFNEVYDALDEVKKKAYGFLDKETIQWLEE